MQICHAITVSSVKQSYNYMEKTSHTSLVFVLVLLLISYYTDHIISAHSLQKYTLKSLNSNLPETVGLWQHLNSD